MADPSFVSCRKFAVEEVGRIAQNEGVSKEDVAEWLDRKHGWGSYVEGV